MIIKGSFNHQNPICSCSNTPLVLTLISSARFACFFWWIYDVPIRKIYEFGKSHGYFEHPLRSVCRFQIQELRAQALEVYIKARKRALLRRPFEPEAVVPSEENHPPESISSISHGDSLPRPNAVIRPSVSARKSWHRGTHGQFH